MKYGARQRWICCESGVFQGRAAMLALDSGQIWWARDESSDRGLVVDAETIYITDADGDIQALAIPENTRP